MTSLRQIESNRRNAEKSTGPKTQNGKQRSSQNAVRHGLTAEIVIGPLEDPADYQAFEQAVTTAYDAETAVERELVLRLASLLWRLRRATSVETSLLQIQYEASTVPDPALPQLPGEPCDVIDIFQSGRETSGAELARCFLRLADLDNGIFERLGRYEAALWRQVRQTIFTLQHLQWRAPGGRYRRTPYRGFGRLPPHRRLIESASCVLSYAKLFSTRNGHKVRCGSRSFGKREQRASIACSGVFTPTATTLTSNGCGSGSSS